MGRTTLLTAIALPALLLAGCGGSGREVFVREGCGSCHRFRDLGSGGALDLTDVASRRDEAWIRRQIRDPRSNDPQSRMPPFPLMASGDVRALAKFLTSQ